MPWVSNHIHIVFSTKNRLPTINEEIQPKLWAYMAGILRNHGMHAVAIGGIEDHIHALINLGGLLGIAKAVQALKANSSRWMNEHPGRSRFACSVSRSLIPAVRKYIANQREHHKKMDFAAELALLLKRHGFEVQK